MFFAHKNRNAPHRTDRSVSPEFIKAAIIGISVLIILIHIGFSKTYIQHFPKFDGFVAAQHFHGIMMMAWLLMLLVQPILILNRKTELHRRIGKFSYALAALVLLSIYFVIQSRYHVYLEERGQTKSVIAWLSLNFRIMVFFAILYALAIYYKHKPALHARFMLSTAILLIAPALVRTLISYQELSHADSHAVDRNANVLIAFIIAAGDSWRTKRLSPFTLVFVFMVLQKILWDVREVQFWQTVGTMLAKMF